MTPSASTKRAPNASRAHARTGSQAAAWRCTSPGRRVGAIEQEVGAEICDDLLGDRVLRRADAVDDGIGQPGERHARRVDHVALRLPLGRERLGERSASARPARRAPACAPACRRAAIAPPQPRRAEEAPPQLRPQAAARRLGGIERLMGEDLFEHVAHGQCHVCLRQPFGSRRLCRASGRKAHQSQVGAAGPATLPEIHQHQALNCQWG